MTTHDITWELIFRLIRFPQPTENTAPIPYNRYPPLNPVKFYTHIYIHTHFGVVPLATVAGYLL